MTEPWHSQKSRDLYNVNHWGGGYFDINEAGQVVAMRSPDDSVNGVSLFQLAQALKAQGFSLPILVRFVDVLRHRVDVLCQAFERAMAEKGYSGEYTAVYPIKVNQNQSVVNEIISHGQARVGLEAGSKPELLAVLAMSRQDGGVVICNGYNDREYIRLALMGLRLGHRVYIVIEKRSELDLVLTESARLGVRPLIGLRVRLSSISAGKWQNSGGEKAKFGLSAGQVIKMIARLESVQMLDCLQLLHCHLGSQIANVLDIQKGMKECARFYAELRGLGANINTVDVGGGLGVDYEGTRSRSFCSTNYSVEEYARSIVDVLHGVCEESALPQPNIITESGRAMTAHHAVLLTNVIDFEGFDSESLDEAGGGINLAEEAQGIASLRALKGVLDQISQPSTSPVELYHNATHQLAEVQALYVQGAVSLAQRAFAEQRYVEICQQLRHRLQSSVRSQREIVDELNAKLADKYFCNFSLFQSMPDVWAIDQIFPIVPLSRLNEEPTRRGVIEDITCDSDGRIDYYVDGEGVESSLPLHALLENEDYYLGVFLVGAYQEILGDMHNLFGDTHSVNVELMVEGGYRLLEQRYGDSVSYVLNYVHFERDELIEAYQQKLTKSTLTEVERTGYLTELTAGLDGYTYLED